MGLSVGCLSIPECLLLREWKPSNCSLFASEGCVKSGGGVFGTVCLRAEASRGGVWWMGGQVCCSALHSRSFPSCIACPAQNSLWPWVLRHISHTHLPTETSFFGEFSTISIFLLLKFLIKQRGKMFLTFTTCEKVWSFSLKTDPKPSFDSSNNQSLTAATLHRPTDNIKSINKLSDEALWA